MKNILLIHQSTDLYGSSKTLFYLAEGFSKKNLNVTVVLPGEGPLSELLIKHGIRVVKAPIMKLSRKMFGFHMIYTLPRDLFTAIRSIDRATRDTKADIVYSNTLAVLIGVIYAKLRKIPHVWHIHEIIERPDLARYVFQKFISFKTNSRIIYNSNATKRFWEGGTTRKSSAIVLNGIPDQETIYTQSEKDMLRKNLFGVGKGVVVVALVGRINKWKGQLFLLEAMKQQLKQNTRLQLIFVGSCPPGQEIYLNKLEDAIRDEQLENKVRIVPFQHNISAVWQAIDIAVVPSTLPEPFGLVSVEAMLCSKPVIAANHGGLTEIVVHKETGLLFEPLNTEALADCLNELIHDEKKRLEMGKKGYERAKLHFSPERYVNDIENICRAI